MKNIIKILSLIIFILSAFYSCTVNNGGQNNNQFSYAKSRSKDLQLSIYITAHAVNNLLSNESGMREAISIFQCNGITKVYIEVYRGGLVINNTLLERVRDRFLEEVLDLLLK